MKRDRERLHPRTHDGERLQPRTHEVNGFNSVIELTTPWNRYFGRIIGSLVSVDGLAVVYGLAVVDGLAVADGLAVVDGLVGEFL